MAKPIKSIANAKSEIQAIAKRILEDKKHLNDILVLMKNLKVESATPSKMETAKALTSMRGLVSIFEALILKGDLDEEDSSEGSDQVKSWLLERLDAYCEALVSFLQEEKYFKNGVADISLVAFFRIIKAKHERNVKKEGHLDHWTGDEVKLFRSLLPALCSSVQNCQHIISKFKEYMEYTDVKQHVIQGLLKYLKQLKKSAKEPTEVFKTNLLNVLVQVKLKKPSAKEPVKSLLCQSDEDESLSYDFDYEAIRKSFSDLWEMVMKYPMTSLLYKKVLVLLNDQVLPHLTRPLLLTDFLMTSYTVGGAVSVLALNGVFTLMQKYNLEYPDFYTKLYALFEPQVLAAKYRARFFYLADIFLSSSHLPEYLVAAFVKRLARLCLHAPANSILLALPFIGNLLLRHQGLSKMLHNKEETDRDPYIMDEADPAKSQAINSCLWELLALQSHVLPQVSQAAKVFSKKLPEMEWDLSQYLELNMDEMMQIETKKKIFVNVPLSFEKPKKMALAKNDLTSQFFSISSQ